MIRSIRSLFNSRAGTFITLGFVGVIGVAFTLGDVLGNGSLGGIGDGNAAKVGGQKITLGELNQSLDNRLRAERQNNPTLDMGRFVEAGGLDSTLDQLINRFALAVFGEKNDIAVSKRLVDYEIRKIPGSTGLDGKFSEQAFRGVLAQLGVTEKLVRDDLTQNLYAQQILPTTIGGPRAPDGLVLPYASLLLEKRSGHLAVVPSVAFLPKQPPNDAALSKYYRDNAIRFTIPEKRAVSYAIFSSDIVAERAKPSNEEIAEYYSENSARYSASQTRDISQVILPTEAAAKALSDRIAKGESITSAANSTGLSVTSFKAISKDDFSSRTAPAVANAVFAAGAGQVVKPVKGTLGWYLVKVDGVQQVAARPLSAVSGEISSILAAQKAEQALSDLTAEIEDEFSNGGTLSDVAKSQGLKIETSPKLFADGRNPENPNYKAIDAMSVILPAAFQMETDGDAQLVEIVPGKQFAMISVAEVEEAAPPPLGEVRDIVVRQWALAEGAKQAKIAAARIEKEVKAGKTLEAALADLKIQAPAVETVSGTRGDLNRNGQPLPPPLALLFSMKKGDAKILPAPNNSGWFIVQVDQIIKGDASGQAEMLAVRKAELTSLMSEEYAAQLVRAAIKDVGVKKNDAALSDLRNRLTRSDNGN